MIATIAAIAGKNVQQSSQLCGNHLLAIIAIIWKRAYMETAQRSKSFLVAIVAIMWKPAFIVSYSTVPIPVKSK